MRKKLEVLSVRNKIRFAVITLIAVFVFAILMSIIGTFGTNSRFRNFYEESYVCSVKQMEIRKDLQYVGKNLMWSITHSDPVEIAERRATAEESLKTLESNIKAMREVYHNEEHLDKLDSLWAELMETHKELVTFMDANDKKGGILLFVGEYENIVLQIQDLLIEIGKESGLAAGAAYRMSRNTGMGSAILLIVLLVISLGLGVYMVKTLTEVITKPIYEIKAAAEQIAEGNLDVQITYTGTDEFGSLADSFRKTCTSLREIIFDLSYMLGKLSEGDFSVESKDATMYVGNFNAIIDDIEAMITTQSDTLLSINQAVSQVNSGAEQLADSAQNIAAGATNQASAVEELSAMISDMISSANESTIKADRATGVVRNSVVEAEQGKVEVAALVEAMERISETSKEIENIIADIEDIASQTNLLSLNASIEAARAGEAGRGFAVVAEQIGKLAANSSQSAVKTREKIGKALEEIQNGSRIVENTTEIITKTIVNMEGFEKISNGMIKSFTALSDMLKQIDTGVEQISDVVQANAAVSEETSAVSEELAAQATALGELTSQFTFRS